jgi:hypothetical protein
MFLPFRKLALRGRRCELCAVGAERLNGEFIGVDRPARRRWTKESGCKGAAGHRSMAVICDGATAMTKAREVKIGHGELKFRGLSRYILELKAR